MKDCKKKVLKNERWVMFTCFDHLIRTLIFSSNVVWQHDENITNMIKKINVLIRWLKHVNITHLSFFKTFFLQSFIFIFFIYFLSSIAIANSFVQMSYHSDKEDIWWLQDSLFRDFHQQLRIHFYQCDWQSFSLLQMTFLWVTYQLQCFESDKEALSS